MDCDTTGVEPEFSLVKWKKLAGGGYFKIVNSSLPHALARLGYTPPQIEDITNHVLGHGTLEGAPHVSPKSLKLLGFTDQQVAEASSYVEKFKSFDDWVPHINPKSLRDRGLPAEQIGEAGIYIGGAQTVEQAPHLKAEHLAIFDCANKCGIGERFIQAMGHVRMMAAVQPFVSGAISKTVNLPHEVTVEDIEKIYVEGWRLGLKALAVYRDGSKHSQPLTTSQDKKAGADEVQMPTGPVRGERIALPQRRHGTTIEASVGGHKLFLRTGEYEDGRLGEIFIDMYKEGAAYRSIVNCFAIAISIGLQYGVPLEKFVNSFTFTRFEPQGMTDHPNIRMSTSILDFVFRVLGMEFLGRTDFVHNKPKAIEDAPLESGGTTRSPDSLLPPDNPLARPGEARSSLAPVSAQSTLDNQLAEMMGDAPICDVCGHVTVRNGSCYKCLSCGNSMGCS